MLPWLVVVLALVAPSHQANLLSEADNLQMVEIHNDLRTKVVPPAKNMKKMVYHADLMESAKSLSMACVFAHEDVDVSNRTFKDFGQNIYVTTRNVSDLNRTAMSWYNEKNDFTYSTLACTRVCGHYTQMVWADSTHMGCSSSWCASVRDFNGGSAGLLTVCNYYPGGNVRGQKPYMELRVCSDCTTDFCRDNCKGKRIPNGSVPKAVSSLWILVLSVPLALCKLL